jgi:hypothetical protein
MDDVGERREAATMALMEAIKTIADEHQLCPVCLMLVIYGSMRDALRDGRIEHFLDRHEGDEGGEGAVGLVVVQ